jgi:hypothetical protein
MSLRWFGLDFSDFRMSPDNKPPNTENIAKAVSGNTTEEATVMDEKEATPRADQKKNAYTTETVHTGSPAKPKTVTKRRNTSFVQALRARLGQGGKKPAEVEDGRQQE